LGENKTESVAKKTTRTRRSSTESSRTHKEMSDGEKIALENRRCRRRTPFNLSFAQALDKEQTAQRV